MQPVPANASYYDRTHTYLDGSRVFQTEADRESEREVAANLEQHWNCELHHYGALAPVDWYATRSGIVVGVLELKTRSHPIGKYPTVFLNVRKWTALHLQAMGAQVPAIFVVRFTDCTAFIPLSEIKVTRFVMGGCVRIVKAENDIEPCVEVPVAAMHMPDHVRNIAST